MKKEPINPGHEKTGTMPAKEDSTFDPIDSLLERERKAFERGEEIGEELEDMPPGPDRDSLEHRLEETEQEQRAARSELIAYAKSAGKAHLEAGEHMTQAEYADKRTRVDELANEVHLQNTGATPEQEEALHQTKLELIREAAKRYAEELPEEKRRLKSLKKDVEKLAQLLKEQSFFSRMLGGSKELKDLQASLNDGHGGHALVAQLEKRIETMTQAMATVEETVQQQNEMRLAKRKTQEGREEAWREARAELAEFTRYKWTLERLAKLLGEQATNNLDTMKKRLQEAIDKP